MRKIMTFGLSILTGTLLVFGTPLAAHAVTTVSTPNKDALCAPGALPLTITNLQTAIDDATTAHDAAVADQAAKSEAVYAAAATLASTAADKVAALDGTGDLAAATTAFNTAATAFATAVTNWQTAYLAAIAQQNILYGSNFLLAFYQGAFDDLPCPIA